MEWKLLLLATVSRAAMITLGEWQDATQDVPYTDIDYLVFTDAAKCVWQNKSHSPFDRPTFRYSPILAYLLLPAVMFPLWGKILFSFGDVAAGYLILRLTNVQLADWRSRQLAAAAWLFNPFTITISTRGNCESILACLLLSFIFLTKKRCIVQSAVVYGLAVHLRIYPILYSLSVLLYLRHCSSDESMAVRSSKMERRAESRSSEGCRAAGESLEAVEESMTVRGSERKGGTEKMASEGCGAAGGFLDAAEESMASKNGGKVAEARGYEPMAARKSVLGECGGWITAEMFVFAAVSGSVFLLLTFLFWSMYGRSYLEEAILYHLTRVDPRHNFSVYFYGFYLGIGKEVTVGSRIFSFAPQFLVQLTFSIKFHRNLPFCMFLQTIAFVAMNKVITAQYFVWFFTLLPLTMPWLPKNFGWKGSLCALQWVVFLSNWLFWAYLLEFQGWNVYLFVWISSLMFFFSTIYVILTFIKYLK